MLQLQIQNDEDMAEVRRAIQADVERLLAEKYISEAVNIDRFLYQVEETIDDDLATLEIKTTYFVLQSTYC